MCYARSSAALSRLSILWGLAALATLLTAFVSNVWLFTWEPVRLPNSDQSTTITFKIGLWRVCPTVKRGNITQHLPSPACSLIKYSTWDEVKHSDLGVWTTLDFTPAFISRMRLSTPFEAVSVFLMLLATMFAVIGHCNGDHKTLVACGLFILGGASGRGLGEAEAAAPARVPAARGAVRVRAHGGGAGPRPGAGPAVRARRAAAARAQSAPRLLLRGRDASRRPLVGPRRAGRQPQRRAAAGPLLAAGRRLGRRRR